MRVIAAYTAFFSVCAFLALQSHIQLNSSRTTKTKSVSVCIPEELAPLANQKMAQLGTTKKENRYYPIGQRSTFAHAGRLACYTTGSTLSNKPIRIFYSVEDAITFLKS